MRPPFLLLPLLLLVQCTDPYGSRRPVFGRSAPPYPEAHEQYRSRMREQDRDLLTQAYERGQGDGFNEARAGLAGDPERGARGLPPAEAGAYRNGYAEGRARGASSGTAPAWQSPGLTTPVAPPASDPAYSQGYDYGLRDRVAGRPADPAAHAGRYDPRHRRSFERGYQDAYEAAR